jgi:hypothetical protein
MKLLLCLLLGAAATVPVAAQSYEYGKPSELKGLKKVFVDTGGDMKNRERILNEIEKANLGIDLLDSADAAEVILNFQGGKEKQLSGVNSTTDTYGNTRGTASYRKITVGGGQVLVVKDGRFRVVLSFDDEEKTVFEKKPATNFGKTFVKAYKKANDLK